MALPIDFEHPFVSQHIFPDNNRTGTSTIMKSSEAVRTRQIRHNALFALGIVLFELCFGQILSDLRIPEDIDATELATNYNIASRLEGHVYYERGARFGDVVRRCLECPFDIRDKTFDNDEFQDIVFDSIVMPLRRELEDFRGINNIR